MLSPILTRLRRRWRRDDPAEGHRFLERAVAECRYADEKSAALEVLSAWRNEPSRDPIRGAAKNDGGELRGRAERARDGMGNAEIQAAGGKRDELDQLKALHREVEQCLQSSVSTLRHAQDLLSAEIMTRVMAAHDKSGRVSLAPRTYRLPALKVLAVSGVLFSLLMVGFAAIRAYSASPQLVGQSAVEPSVRSTPLPSVPESTGTTPPQESLPEANSLVLTLTANRACWIRTVVDGTKPMQRLMQPGETIFVRADEEAVVRLGDATALSVTINGRAAAPFGRQGEAVTRRITRANYKDFLAAQL